MARRIFVSYNFNDRKIAHSITAMQQGNGGYVQGQFVFVTNDVSYLGVGAIDGEIKNTMSLCDAALFIVGDNNHNSPWIDREVTLAISKGLRIVVTRLPNTYGAVPAGLRSSRHEEVSWSPRSIGVALNN